MIKILKNKNIKEILTKPLILGVLALFSCFLWGSAFPSIKKGYELFQISSNDTYGQIIFAGLRFLLSGLMVFSICLICKYSIKVTKQQLLKLIILGILQTTLQYFFFYIGMSNISGTRGSILAALATFFSVIIAPFFFEEEGLNLKKIAGVTIGFLGVVILNYQGIASGTFHMYGEGFIIISSLVSAFASIYTKKLTGVKIPSFAISGYQLFIGGLVLAVSGVVGSGGKMVHFSTSGVLLLIYMGFISAAAFSIWTILLKYNGVGKIMIYKFSIPLFGAGLSFFILQERNIQSNVIIAAILVVVGILLINIEKKNYISEVKQKKG